MPMFDRPTDPYGLPHELAVIGLHPSLRATGNTLAGITAPAAYSAALTPILTNLAATLNAPVTALHTGFGKAFEGAATVTPAVRRTNATTAFDAGATTAAGALSSASSGLAGLRAQVETDLARTRPGTVSAAAETTAQSNARARLDGTVDTAVAVLSNAIRDNDAAMQWVLAGSPWGRALLTSNGVDPWDRETFDRLAREAYPDDQAMLDRRRFLDTVIAPLGLLAADAGKHMPDADARSRFLAWLFRVAR